MTGENELLIKRAKSGDLKAFEDLIKSYEKRIFNIAYRMFGNFDDAADISQEAFLKLYRSIKDFKGQSSLSTWIYRLTTNTCLDEIRRRKNKQSISIEEVETQKKMEKGLISTEENPEKSYEKKVKQKIIQNAICELSYEYKTVVVLRDIQGFTYEEIAQILQCSIGTVKSRLHRGRKELKELLINNQELFEKEYV